MFSKFHFYSHFFPIFQKIYHLNTSHVIVSKTKTFADLNAIRFSHNWFGHLTLFSSNRDSFKKRRRQFASVFSKWNVDHTRHWDVKSAANWVVVHLSAYQFSPLFHFKTFPSLHFFPPYKHWIYCAHGHSFRSEEKFARFSYKLRCYGH